MQTSITPALVLNEELERRIRKNPLYSLRSFANALSLSPGELSEIIRGKRKVSLKAALKISKGLLMSPVQTEEFLMLIQQSEAGMAGVSLSKIPIAGKALSEDVFRVISDWYCFTILSLAEIKGFKLEPHPIAKFLKISVTEARLALERLERVGALKNVRGKFVVESGYFLSSDEIPNEAVRHCHTQLLEKAKAALETQTLAEREIGGITFAVDPRYLPELKNDLKKFLDSWAERLEETRHQNKTEVYQLETILFRLTEKGESL
jgi:uncharacterized protein (TIGR02147 family)